jgi:hypothetical protein
MTVTDRYHYVLFDSRYRDVTAPEVAGLIISQAQGILSRVDDSFPWPGDDGGSVATARYALEEALDAHGRLRTRELHPASEFPDLEDETGALEIALEKVTEDISDWAGALVTVVREYCGDEVAAYVSGVQGCGSDD